MQEIQKILDSAGFPTNILILDFETFYDDDYNLRDDKSSTIEYITDPRFECLGFGVWKYPDTKYGDGADNFYGKHEVQGLLDYYTTEYGKNWNNVTLGIQNCFFDPVILAEHYDIFPRYILDIRYLDRHIEARASHKLADMVKRWEIGKEKGDTSQFKGLHWRDIKGEPKYELPLIDYCLNDIYLEKKLLFKLLPQISRPEIELPLMNHTAQMFMDTKLQLDTRKARILIPKMTTEMDKSLQGMNRKMISGDISFTKLLVDAMPEGESIPLKPGKPTKNMLPLTGPGLIPATSKEDAEIDTLKFHDKKEVRDLINARLALRSWPLHMKKLRRLINQAKARDGWLGIPLHYYGGHTGRWSGAEKINVQNFAERVHPLMGEIKKCIKAPDGKSLIILDLAQIECRDLAYMAGQQDILDCFSRGDDIYSEFATELFQEEVRKPTKDDSKDLYDKLYLNRYIGKQAVLGLGYEMGVDRFFNQIQEYEVVRDLVKKGLITKDFTRKAVKLYRSMYQYIPEFWREVEKNFKWVIKYPHEIKEMDCGLKFWKEGSTVRVQLPSGRIQNYPRSSYRAKSGLRWQYGKLYGGALTENFTQACSRDIFAEGLLKCWDAGFNPVMHVHDSLTLCVDGDDAERVFKEASDIMTTAPEWCKDIPLDVEGKVGRYYE